MLVALILDRQLDVLPTHVELGDQRAVFVNRYLRLRRREARADQQEPQPGFAGRLGARVNEWQRYARAGNAAAASVALGE